MEIAILSTGRTISEISALEYYIEMQSEVSAPLCETERRFHGVLKRSKKAVDDFYRFGGLKLIISGGEPLLHPEIFRFLEYSRKYPLRIVLLTKLSDKQRDGTENF